MRVAGFGFRQSATLDSLRSALAACDAGPLNAIATPSDKAESAAFLAFAEETDLPVIKVDADSMQTANTQTHSTKVQEKRGTGSVAEACALVGAGDAATLTQPRVVSGDRLATCAIAEGAPK